MKKKIFMMILACVMLVFSSCSRPETEKEPINPDEMMKISAWLLDSELEGTGRWGYTSHEKRTAPYYPDGNGYWIPDDGVTQVKNEDVFVFESLTLGVPRTMAPMSMHMKREEKGDSIGYSNLNLHIDFDGIVEVTKIEPNDSSIRLWYSLDGPPIEAENIRISSPCVINVCPVGKKLETEGTHSLISEDTLVNKEYTLQISGFTLRGEQVVTAQVKLKSIPDPEYPWQTVHQGRYGEHYTSGEELTRFCSIELISYTVNEMYLISEGMQ